MLSQQETKRLLDIAYIGVQHGKILPARTIFQAILADQPGQVSALIGMAYSHMVVDSFEEAERLLRDEVLASHPDDPDALVFLGLNALLAKRPDEARLYLDRVPADSTAAALAEELKLQL